MSTALPIEDASPLPTDPNAPPKGALGTVFLIVLIDLMGFGIIIPLLPLIAKTYHASDLQVGLLFTVYSACQFVGSPVLGALSDRYGRRPVLILSQFGSALGYLLLGVVLSLGPGRLGAGAALALIYLSRVIDGLTGGNVSTAQAYISDVTPAENRAHGMAIIGAAFGVGFAVGPAMGGVLSHFHPSWPGYAAALLSLIAAVMTHRRLKETRVHQPSAVSSWLHPDRFAPLLRDARLMQLILIVFISMAAFVMLESFAALYVSDRATFGYGELGVGLFYAYLGVVIALVQGGMIRPLAKRYGEWPLAILGPVLVAAGMAMFVGVSAHPVLWLLLLGGAVNATGRSLQTPTLFSLISKQSDPKEQGTVFGLNQGLGSLARVIGPAVAGVAYGHRHWAPFALAGAIVLIAAAWTAALRGREPAGAADAEAEERAVAETV